MSCEVKNSTDLFEVRFYKEECLVVFFALSVLPFANNVL
jgi:hypothetical protein